MNTCPRALWIAAAACLAVVIGCASSKPASAPAPPTLKTVSVEKPTLTLAPNYQFAKEVEGVTITLTPVEFTEKRYVQRQMEKKPALLTVAGISTYIVTDTQIYVYEPKEIIFKLSIVNRMDHVLRFKDCVTSFTVAGKPYAGLNTEELQALVLVPGQTWEGTLQGPECASLTRSSNLVFSIYDVVTAVDAANNPTKKTNFEWVFTYDVEPLQKEVAVERYEHAMTPEEAEAYSRGQ